MSSEIKDSIADLKGAENSPRRKAIYWLRRLLVPPAVSAACVFTGIAGGLPCLFLRFERGLFLIAPLCAIAWVVAAYAMAPSHKTRTAVVAYGVGAIAAWFLAGSDPFRSGGRLLTFALACTGGMGALLVCLPSKTRSLWLRSVTHELSARSISNSINTIHQFITKELKENSKWIISGTQIPQIHLNTEDTRADK